MEISVRACANADEMRQAFVIWHYFGMEPSEDSIAPFYRILPADRMHGAWDGETCVGGAGAYPLELNLGERRVATSGTTIVGVAPTHRRRGVLTALMRAHLDAAHERGEPIAWLWASEGAIYRRFGYGLASSAVDIDLPRAHSAFLDARPPTGRARLVTHTEAMALMPRVYDAVAAQNVGLFSRTPAWWDARRLADQPWRRNGAGALNRLVIEEGGEPVAYALYRVRQQLDHGVSRGTVVVLEAMGVTPEATRSVWRLLFDIDWNETISAVNLPVDHALFHLLAEPRRMNARVVDALWVRLVDLGAALSLREWASGEPLVLEVGDAFCPWNGGRWRLADGRAERTTQDADLRLTAEVLGSAYLGASRFRALHAAGRVEELRPGALARADRVFASDRAPWCPEIF